jgi:hypothetical protein
LGNLQEFVPQQDNGQRLGLFPKDLSLRDNVQRKP